MSLIKKHYSLMVHLSLGKVSLYQSPSFDCLSTVYHCLVGEGGSTKVQWSPSVIGLMQIEENDLD